MKKILSLILFIHSISLVLAQGSKLVKEKPPVDFETIESWPSVGGAAISNNGQYALYYINNQPVHNCTLVVVSTKNNWKKEVIGANDAVFSEDSRMAVFKTAGDSLCMLTLGGDKAEYIPDVKSFKLFILNKTEYLLYHLNTKENELVLRDMGKSSIKTFNNVDNYLVSKEGNSLLLQFQKDNEKQILNWVQLPDGEAREIWQGENAGNFVFDNKGKQLVFIIKQPVNGKPEQSFWYYRNGMDKAALLADNRTLGIDSGFVLNGIDRFSMDGTKLFFKVREPDIPKPKTGAIMVDVWSYSDPKLQSQQLKELTPDRWGDGTKSYLSVLNIANKTITQLQHENEIITLFDGRSDEWGFITCIKGTGGEYWNNTSQPAYFLVSTNTGRRKRMEMDVADRSSLSMSPNGKYIILAKEQMCDLFSYEIATGIIRSITKELPIPKVDSNYDWVRPVRGIRLAAWTENNNLLIYDSYDTWLIDPIGKNSPMCLTNFYGRKNNLVFRLPGNIVYRDKVIKSNEKLMLSVFNNDSKDNGFYSIAMGRKENPKLLTMGAYAYYHPTIDAGFFMQPQKAKYAEVWLVGRESASASPNLFITADFKTFTQLSTVYPERSHNWFTTKLINYKTLDGKQSQGILYLPENLDTVKKNPVIIYYYEKLSQHLNDYKAPEFSSGWMEIPYFVSQGYIVFTPDIQFTPGHHSESTCNSVIGAANYLRRISWIDSTKMAAQGHSMGGFETNNIVTHTNMFAAACAAAGTSDLISHFGQIRKSSGVSLQEFAQYRMGTTIWERPDLYIENSPIFRIDKITTPLLIMHNKEDGAVPFEQGIELFTALRRLGKRAWMLQYDGEGHSVSGETEKDLTIRMKQFFDHYLRDSLPPKWMTRGIPAKFKGVDDGLELDYEIKTPPEGGLLTPEEKIKIDSLKYRKPVTVTFD